jgi:hypothetical protein
MRERPWRRFDVVHVMSDSTLLGAQLHLNYAWDVSDETACLCGAKLERIGPTTLAALHKSLPSFVIDRREWEVLAGWDDRELDIADDTTDDGGDPA